MVDTFKDNWYPGAPGNDTTTAGVADGTTATATLSSTPSDTPGSGSLAATPPYDALWESEYVRVTGVNVGTKVITMARAQYGSAGVAHASSARLHHIFTAAGILSLIHANDYLRQYNAAGAFDAKYWTISQAAGVWSLAANNDALSASTTAISVGRTGYVNTIVAIGASPLASSALYLNTGHDPGGATGYGVFSSPILSANGGTNYAAVGAWPQIGRSGTVAAIYGYWAISPSNTGGATITTVAGLYVDAMTAGGTNNYGVYINAPSGGSGANVGLYNVGTTRLGSNTVVGASTLVSYVAFQVTVGTSGNVDQYGITSQVTYDSAATGAIYEFLASGASAAATYTTTNRYGLYVADFGNGTGHTLTNNYGVYIAAQTAGGTANLGLYNAGDTQLAGMVNIGGTGTNVSENVLINTTLTSTGASQYGVVVQTMPSASATANYFTMYVQPNTAAGSYTVGNVFGIYVTDAQKGAGCTITSQYGIYIAAITSATSQNWAVYSAGTAYSQFGGPIQCASYFWAFSGSYYVRMYHDGSNGQIDHSGGSLVVGSATGGIYIQPASGQHIVANLSGGGAFLPNADNSWTCGGASNRWTAVYAVNGAIQTSSRAMKHSEQALAPADALAAVMGTDYIRYQYVTRPLEDDADDDAKARHERVAAWVHTGYYAEDAHALLKLDDESVSAQNTASVALAAIKEVEMRRAALEDRIVDLEAEVTRLRKLVKAA